MGVFGIFVGKKEAARIARRTRNRAESRAEDAIEGIHSRQKSLDKECAKLWEKARQQLLSGQKAAAAATLRIYKSKQAMANSNERQYIMARHQADIMTNASMMQNVATVLKNLAEVSNVDPDSLAEEMETVAEVSDDIRETGKIMEKSYERSMAKLDRELEDSSDMVGDDELMKILETETAGSVMGAHVTESSGKVPTVAEINSGRDNLNKLINNI